MITAGVLIDGWKLAIFKKHLDEKKFAYSEHGGIIEGTLTLRVQCESAEALQPTIFAANNECARMRMN